MVFLPPTRTTRDVFLQEPSGLSEGGKAVQDDGSNKRRWWPSNATLLALAALITAIATLITAVSGGLT
jgi:hypothetical protein